MNTYMVPISFNLKDISTYRTSLMGIATVGILMCHATSYGSDKPFLFGILGLGQLGVLLFFFLSGIGIYYSLSPKNVSRGAMLWYKKRFVRLLVPYIFIYGAALIIESLSNGSSSFWEFVYKLSTISYWFGDSGCWFIAVIIPMYLIAPLWKQMLESVKYPLIPTSIIVSAMLLSNTLFSEAFAQGAFFFLGFYMGKHVFHGHEISQWGGIGISLATFGMLTIYYLMGIGKLLVIIFPMVILLCCKLLSFFRDTWVFEVFNGLGKVSLESYLFNVTLIIWIDYFHLLPASVYSYRYVFVVCFGVIFSVVFHNLFQWMINRL